VRTPEITAIIPTYNRAHTIHAAIDTVLDQTFPVGELIVVDDGSQDETKRALADRYGDRIVYLRQENAGPSAARNLGIRAARFPWIAFLDSDDLWHPRKLEVQSATLATPEVVVSCTNFTFIDAPEENHFQNIGLELEAECPAFEWPLGLMSRFGGSGILLSGAICSRDAMLRVGLFDERMRIAEDTRLFYELAREGKFVLVREPLYSRRRDTEGGQLTESDTSSWGRIHADASMTILRESLAAAADQPADVHGSLRHLLAYFLSKQAQFHALDGEYAAARRSAVESLSLSRRGKTAAKALLGLVSPRLLAARSR
jgi:glycosyltransferase involved in cell wall biosynthesis